MGNSFLLAENSTFYDFLSTTYKLIIGLITKQVLTFIALGAILVYLVWICFSLGFCFARKFYSRCTKINKYIDENGIKSRNEIDEKVSKLSGGFAFAWKKFRKSQNVLPSDVVKRRDVLDVEINGGILNQGKSLMKSYIYIFTTLLFIFNLAMLGNHSPLDCYIVAESMILPIVFLIVIKLFYFLYTTIKQQIYNLSVEAFYELIEKLDNEYKVAGAVVDNAGGKAQSSEAFFEQKENDREETTENELKENEAQEDESQENIETDENSEEKQADAIEKINEIFSGQVAQDVSTHPEKNSLDEYDIFKKKNIDVEKLVNEVPQNQQSGGLYINVDSDYVIKDDENVGGGPANKIVDETTEDVTVPDTEIAEDQSAEQNDVSDIEVENAMEDEGEGSSELPEAEQPEIEESEAEDIKEENEVKAPEAENSETEQEIDENIEDSEIETETEQENAEPYVENVESEEKTEDNVEEAISSDENLHQEDGEWHENSYDKGEESNESDLPVAEEETSYQEGTSDKDFDNVEQGGEARAEESETFDDETADENDEDIDQDEENKFDGTEENVINLDDEEDEFSDYSDTDEEIVNSDNENETNDIEFFGDDDGGNFYLDSSKIPQQPESQDSEEVDAEQQDESIPIALNASENEQENELQENLANDEDSAIDNKNQDALSIRQSGDEIHRSDEDIQKLRENLDVLIGGNSIKENEEDKKADLEQETEEEQMEEIKAKRGRPKSNIKIEEGMTIASDAEFEECLSRAEKLMRKSEEGLSQSQSKRIEKELKILIDAMNKYKEN